MFMNDPDSREMLIDRLVAYEAMITASLFNRGVTQRGNETFQFVLHAHVSGGLLCSHVDST